MDGKVVVWGNLVTLTSRLIIIICRVVLKQKHYWSFSSLRTLQPVLLWNLKRFWLGRLNIPECNAFCSILNFDSHRLVTADVDFLILDRNIQLLLMLSPDEHIQRTTKSWLNSHGSKKKLPVKRKSLAPLSLHTG